MGDRSYWQFHVREDCVEAFARDIVGAATWKNAALSGSIDPDGEHNGFIACSADEANFWGPLLELDQGRLDRTGLVFYGFAGTAPGAWDETHFVCDGEHYYEVAALDNAGLAVTVDENGDPNPDEVANVKAYLATLKRVKGE